MRARGDRPTRLAVSVALHAPTVTVAVARLTKIQVEPRFLLDHAPGEILLGADGRQHGQLPVLPRDRGGSPADAFRRSMAAMRRSSRARLGISRRSFATGSATVPATKPAWPRFVGCLSCTAARWTHRPARTAVLRKWRQEPDE